MNPWVGLGLVVAGLHMLCVMRDVRMPFGLAPLVTGVHTAIVVGALADTRFGAVRGTVWTPHAIWFNTALALVHYGLYRLSSGSQSRA